MYFFSNILDVGTFPGCNTRRTLAYAAIQVLIRELEEARIKRDAIPFSAETSNPSSNPQSKPKTTVISEINRSRAPRLVPEIPSVSTEGEFKKVKKVRTLQRHNNNNQVIKFLTD